MPDGSLGLAYEVNADGTTCTIVGLGSCTDTDVVIPISIGGYKVTAIGENAFSECIAMTAISIPDTVRTIGRRAFYGCTGLTEITIPSSVTNIGLQVFYKASNLSTVYYNSGYGSSENLFLSLSHITKVVFGGSHVPSYILQNNSAVKEVVLNNSVTSIDSHAFSGCSSLTEIVLPDGVTSIRRDAFSGCSSLTEIIIPRNVATIGMFAFSGCTNLAKVYITDLEAWYNISFSDYGSNPMCNGADLYLNGELVTEIEIPDTIGVIKAYTFCGCKSLTSVIISDEVTSIGDCAFFNCIGLSKIEIPDSVISLGEVALSGCTSLTEIVIPDSVNFIGGGAFYDCTSLTSITFDGTVEQWNMITKGEGWNYNVPARQVICSDGAVSIW